MQPAWLQSALQRWIYRAGVIVSVALVYVLVEGLTGFLIGLAPPGPLRAAFRQEYAVVIPNRATDLVIKLLIGLAIGAFVATRKTIVPIETLRWSGAHAWLGTTRWLGRAAAAAMDYGLYVGIAVGLIVYARATFGANSLWSAAASGWVKSGLVAGAAVCLLFIIGLGMLPKPSAAVRQRIRPRLTTRGADALMSGLLVGVGASLAFGIGTGVLTAVCIALIAGLSGGDAIVGGALRQGTDDRDCRSPRDRIRVRAIVAGEARHGLDGALAFRRSRLRSDGRIGFSTLHEAPADERSRGRSGAGVIMYAWLLRRWGRWVFLGIVTAAIVAVACTAPARWGRMPLLRGIANGGNLPGRVDKSDAGGRAAVRGDGRLHGGDDRAFWERCTGCCRASQVPTLKGGRCRIKASGNRRPILRRSA